MFLRFNTAQKMRFFFKDFFGKCDKIRRKLQIWSHLLKKSLMENFSMGIFSLLGKAVLNVSIFYFKLLIKDPQIRVAVGQH